MRILILTQWFQPESFFKGLPFAKELVKRGHEVHVLTGFPNYPGGRLYPGYKVKLWDYEEMDGIPVYRVVLYPSHDNSAIGRILNYISFAMSASLIGLFLIPKVDVVYVYHPPATIGLPAIIFKLLRGIPFVYDIQDLWPDTLQITGMFNNRLGLQIVHKWCYFIYKQAARIVVLSPGFKEKLRERGVPRDKIEVIYNWTTEEDVLDNRPDECLAQELGLAGRFNVVFAGNMGLGQDLDAVLDAAGILLVQGPNVQFVFLGGGVDEPRLKERVKKMNLLNVIFLPRRLATDMSPIYAIADVLLVHLKDHPLFRITIPGKIQAYLHFGKPIIIGVRGDAADLVQQAGAGITCEPENPKSIADAVAKMSQMPLEKLDEMGKNGRRFYERELSLNVGVSRFDKLFREVVSK